MRKKTSFLIFPMLIMGVLLLFATACKKDDGKDKGGDNADVPNVSFGDFTDTRDGKVYKTVTIGSQQWMAENLAHKPTGGSSWAYGNDEANVDTYGYLYNYATAMDVCPDGWHLPDDAEWIKLIDYVGSNAGGKLKATGTIEEGTGLWHSPNTGATNKGGFSALPGGLHNPVIGTFLTIGEYGQWWTATTVDGDPDYAYSRRMKHDADDVSRVFSNKPLAYSVRCVRDN